jgi:cephalosporin hydroxylase
MMSLWTTFLTHAGGTAMKWKHYFPAYERHLSRYVNRPVLLLEIGVAGGGSLQIWKKYLGAYARIVGIDVIEGCRNAEEDQVAVRIGSQSDLAFLDSLLQEFGTPDIVIDDGSHRAADMIATFDHLYHRMASNGVYAVEDLHSSYAPDNYGFIELCKRLIDELHGRYARDKRTEFTDTTLSMHFYDSLVIFEKGWIPNRVAPRTGAAGGPAIIYHDGVLRALDPGEKPPQSD